MSWAAIIIQSAHQWTSRHPNKTVPSLHLLSFWHSQWIPQWLCDSDIIIHLRLRLVNDFCHAALTGSVNDDQEALLYLPHFLWLLLVCHCSNWRRERPSDDWTTVYNLQVSSSLEEDRQINVTSQINSKMIVGALTAVAKLKNLTSPPSWSTVNCQC